MSGSIELMKQPGSAARRAGPGRAVMRADPITGRPRPRMLIGGLGMGFTLRSALAELPGARTPKSSSPNSLPAVVAWARGPMAHIFDG